METSIVSYIRQADLAIFGSVPPGFLGEHLLRLRLFRDLHDVLKRQPKHEVEKLFVLALLLYIVWRFNAKANPVPSKNSHNTVLEVIWTVIPVAILVIMAIGSKKIHNIIASTTD